MDLQAKATGRFNYLPAYYHKLKPFKDYFQTGIPMLTYHALSPPTANTAFRGIFCKPEKFSRQMNELRRAGFRSVTPAETRVRHHGLRISLTFDDGFASLSAHALEPLVKNGFSATVFLVANMLGKTNRWDAPLGVKPCPLMDINQVNEWLAAGNRIGSHTLNHVHLPRLSQKDAWEEIHASKNKLENIFGVPVTDFCYPYGKWTQRDADMIAESGYQTACTTVFGLNTETTSPYALNRLTVRRPVRNMRTLHRWLWRNYFGLVESFMHQTHLAKLSN